MGVHVFIFALTLYSWPCTETRLLTLKRQRIFVCLVLCYQLIPRKGSRAQVGAQRKASDLRDTALGSLLQESQLSVQILAISRLSVTTYRSQINFSSFLNHLNLEDHWIKRCFICQLRVKILINYFKPNQAFVRPKNCRFCAATDIVPTISWSDAGYKIHYPKGKPAALHK